MDLLGKRFVASYSGGKDSVLAINRAMGAGLLSIGLITTYNTDADRSWFHGMSGELLQRASESLAMPLTYIKTSGEQYAENFERTLSELKTAGAEVCVFGDIDIEGHFEWCSARCENAGLIPYFPLKGEERKRVVYEFIDAGFSAVIKIVDTSRLPEEFLGKTLSRAVVDEIEKHGADICGENGEYHTFVYDGPLFSTAIEFSAKETIRQGDYTILNINI